MDEPTNYLDQRNRQSLMRMLRHFEGTVLVVSHDVELLRTCVDVLWNVEHATVTVFNGSYDAFIGEQEDNADRIEKRIKALENRETAARSELVKQRERSARRARANKNENDRKLVGYLKGLADDQLGKNQGRVGELKGKLIAERRGLRRPEEIVATFDLLSADNVSAERYVIEVSEGSVGYSDRESLLKGIHMLVAGGERVALTGNNGAGKTTLMKALLGKTDVFLGGSWVVPTGNHVGYLDQHYKNLDGNKTVFEIVQACSELPDRELRAHLNTFLFRKNEEVQAQVSALSGGERVRLTLACIALQQPSLLFLDEVTSNLDLQTREHVIQVLNRYPGTLVVISHDEDFLSRIGVTIRYEVKDGRVEVVDERA